MSNEDDQYVWSDQLKTEHQRNAFHSFLELFRKKFPDKQPEEGFQAWVKKQREEDAYDRRQH